MTSPNSALVASYRDTIFNVTFQCDKHPLHLSELNLVKLSFNATNPNYTVVGGFDHFVHVIQGQLYQENAPRTVREAAPQSGLSTGTMPQKTASTGDQFVSKSIVIFSANSTLHRCYQAVKKANPLMTTDVQNLVVEQFFASAARAFPHDMGIECAVSELRRPKHLDIAQARACQRASEAFWQVPFTVFTRTGFFGTFKGYTVEPSCGSDMTLNRDDPNNAYFQHYENAERCRKGWDRMGMPSAVEKMETLYQVVPRSVPTTQ